MLKISDAYVAAINNNPHKTGHDIQRRHPKPTNCNGQKKDPRIRDVDNAVPRIVDVKHFLDESDC
jgi:hypothetical protein